MNSWSLFLNIVISSLGIAYFTYGKKTARFSYILSGVLLMAYSYFFASIIWIIVIGVCISLMPIIVEKVS